MVTLHCANWKLTFGGTELFTADVVHVWRQFFFCCWFFLPRQGKLWGEKGGKSVVMKPDYIYDSGVFLSFVSPLQDSLQPRKIRSETGPLGEQQVWSLWAPAPCPALTCYFQKKSVLFPAGHKSAPCLRACKVWGLKLPDDHVCKTKCHSFFIELWNPQNKWVKVQCIFLLD